MAELATLRAGSPPESPADAAAGCVGIVCNSENGELELRDQTVSSPTPETGNA